jgi:hypothetical protein
VPLLLRLLLLPLLLLLLLLLLLTLHVLPSCWSWSRLRCCGADPWGWCAGDGAWTGFMDGFDGEIKVFNG